MVLGRTSLAQLSAWQDYASRKLFIQEISIPLTARNNFRVLPGHTGIVSLALKLSKTSFIPCQTVIGKGSPRPIAYDKPIDPAEMPCISTCTEMTTEDTNVPTQDDTYLWLDPDDK